jgi:hypothetical protein
MAITRTQIARQLYRDAGYVQAAYGKSAAEPGPVEYDTGLEKQRTENVFNEIKPKDELDVNEVLTKAGDVQRIKNAVTGGGLKALISPQMIIGKLIIDQITKDKDKNQTIVTPQFADGGDVVGGLADGNIDETGRQMYGLGKLIKKFTRGVKKVIKSPIGKAALLYTGLGGLGNLAQGANFFTNFASPTKFIGGALGGIKGKLLGIPGVGMDGGTPGLLKNLGLTKGGFGTIDGITGRGIYSAMTATSILPLLGLGTGEETEEEAQAILDNSGIDVAALRNDPQLARRFAAEGGSMDEPVAKKTMPLLDMDGKEMDLRQDGGFVPIGRMEKADDVPARLSKNEFVFTADAVRNAGDGSVDKGAEVMYNMMKNLEAGGDVSEESQGMDGAREMFQTSKRLEEVL